MRLSKEFLLPAVLVGGLIVAVLVVTTLQRITMSSLERKIAQVEAEKLQYSKELEEIRRLESLRGELQRRVEAVRMLDRGRKFWVEVLEDLNLRLPSYVWLSLVEETQLKQQPSEGEAATLISETVIHGYAFTLRGLASFLNRLKGSPFLKEAKLSYFRLGELEGGRRVYSFELKCRLSAAVEASLAAAA